MTVANELHDLIREFYLTSTPLGDRLQALVPRIEALERGSSPVSDQPEPKEPDAQP